MEHSNPLLRGNEDKNRFITIGEIMLRLTPPNYEKIRTATSFEASYGGSEANIALSLANLGVDSTFFSVVPNNSVGKSAIRMLRSNDVHCTPVILSSHAETPTHRLGSYYLDEDVILGLFDKVQDIKVINAKIDELKEKCSKEREKWEVIYEQWSKDIGIASEMANATLMKQALFSFVTFICNNNKLPLHTEDIMHYLINGADFYDLSGEYGYSRERLRQIVNTFFVCADMFVSEGKGCF